MEKTCAHCSVRFADSSILGRTYCSRTCKKRAHKKRRQPEQVARQRLRQGWTRKRVTAVEWKPRTCPQCQSEFIRKPSSKQIFCTVLCQYAAMVRPSKPYKFRVFQSAECKVCQTVFDTLCLHAQYCSDACYKKNHNRLDRLRLKRVGRVGNLRRRVERHRCVYRTLLPHKIWLRDKGLCHLCNKETPWELRGTYHPDAPEVDHLIPVSRAAELGFAETAHSYDYVRIAHRHCNVRRSAKLLDVSVSG